MTDINVYGNQIHCSFLFLMEVESKNHIRTLQH